MEATVTDQVELFDEAGHLIGVIQRPAVRDLLGPASVVMTGRCAHLAPEDVRAAGQRLEGQSRSGHATHKDAGAGSS